MFDNEPGDQSLIPGRVIPKTKKMLLDAAKLNTSIIRYRYGWREVVPFPTPPFCCKWKWGLHVTLDNRWPTTAIYRQLILIKRSSLTLYRQPSLSFICSDGSFRQRPISTHSWCIQILVTYKLVLLDLKCLVGLVDLFR